MSGWNGRLYGAGSGGFAGTIAYSPGVVEAVQNGAAGVSTDTGHFSICFVMRVAKSFLGSPVLGHFEF